MHTKLILFFLFAAVCPLAFSQNRLENNDSAAKKLAPIEDKAIVYIIRRPGFVSAKRMNMECDSLQIGSPGLREYIYIVLKPGKHIFTAKLKDTYKLELNTEPKNIYYIKQLVKMGMLHNQPKLKLLNSKDGKKYLSKCRLSTDDGSIIKPLSETTVQNKFAQNELYSSVFQGAVKILVVAMIKALKK